MFNRYGNGTQGLDTGYGYNDRSELTAEQTKLGGTSTVLTGRDDAYAFDHIGNRATATHNGSTATYTANSLNQYSQRTTPGVIDVAGLAPAAAAVTVNTSTAGITRHGDYYFKNYGVTNTTAVWQSLNIASSLGGSTTRFSFVPPTPEPFTYDLDGNLTSDGRWDYTYDAENRLVTMQTKVGAVAPNGPIPQSDARRLEFKNDYLGRRVRKTVYSGWNGAAFTTTLSDTKNLYHGWNLLAEFDASSGSSPLPLLRSFIWGLDWSGTLQGAGGVGGLLNIHDHATATSMRPAYDGNGNLMALLKATDGTLAAAYEYDAFGNTLAAYGTHAATNPFRFSTKYTDPETGLIYYGLRYYSPTLGRFVNRDPIEEQGGLNLYAFCGNDGVNKWDYLGMVIVTIDGKTYDVVPVLTSVFNPELQNAIDRITGGMWTADPQKKWGLSFRLFYSTATGFGYRISPYRYVYLATPVSTTPPPPPPPTPTEPIYYAPPSTPASQKEPGSVFSHIAGGKLGATAVIYNGLDEGGFHNGEPMANGHNFQSTAAGLKNSPNLFVPGDTINATSFDRALNALGNGTFRSFVIVDHASEKGLSFNRSLITDEQWARLAALGEENGPRFIIHYGCDIANGSLETLAYYAKTYNFSIITHFGKTNFAAPDGAAIFNYNSTATEWFRIDPDGRLRKYRANGQENGPTDVWEHIVPLPPGSKTGK